MSTYKIRPNAAHEIGDNLNHSANIISSRLDEQAQQIQSHLREWEAEDRDEYFNRKKQWEQIAHGMPKSLQYIKANLEQIVQNYQTTTKRALNTWSGYDPSKG